jgi:hypothetical protein
MIFFGRNTMKTLNFRFIEKIFPIRIKIESSENSWKYFIKFKRFFFLSNFTEIKFKIVTIFEF